MARGGLLLLVVLLFNVVFGIQNICLYSSLTNSTLKPLQLMDTDCPKNTSYCMNTIYNYGNFQYNGIAALKPKLGEVVAFLTQTAAGLLDLVIMLNANKDVTSQVFAQITGASPTPILLYDDPTNDVWNWNPSTNTGNFSWTTKPGYTDGVVIGHINFIDNYCVSSTFTQISGAITNVSVLSGTTKNVTRPLSAPYSPGSTFTFCQYPVTKTSYTNASCPGVKDGSATMSITFGPSNVVYRWYDVNNNLVGTTPTVNNLGAGTYSVFMNDSSTAGCDAHRVVTITEHTLNGGSVATTPFSCSPKGTATATPDGGGSGAFTYSWFKSGATTPFSSGSSNSISGLDVGQYFVRIIDSCGSTKDIVFSIATTGCCGDGICQANEVCTGPTFCAADCGVCCQPGTYVSGNGCQVCPPGSYSTTTQAASCTSCPANTFNAGGNDACAPCPDNYYSASGSGKCDRCPAGQVRIGSASSCSACNPGSYAPPCDGSDCTACPAGTMSASAGASVCSWCPAGSFSTGGASACSPCAAGSYASAGASSCNACPSGTTSGVGASHILACINLSP